MRRAFSEQKCYFNINRTSRQFLLHTELKHLMNLYTLLPIPHKEGFCSEIISFVDCMGFDELVI
jgi:hypothetical protein